MRTLQASLFLKRLRIGVDIFARVVAVVVCLPLFVAMFAEMRKRI